MNGLNEQRNAEFVFSVLNRMIDSEILNIRTVRSSFMQESYNLYVKYQIIVHKDKEEELTPSKYSRFLVESPLTNEGQFGSFHQLYYINGKLIATGVLDILPKCVSSVYFFYDPEFEKLSLGTFSALQEISLTHSLSRNLPSLHYYYMGYYIHKCPKMKYKGKFEPSELMDPISYSWCLLKNCTDILDYNDRPRLCNNPHKSFSGSSKIFIIKKNNLYEFQTFQQIEDSDIGDESLKRSLEYLYENIGEDISNFLFFYDD
ncbi:hypothetical protein ROZALSC1DRAFT_28909 [Rozella allomycis CSF55]|uniref:Arginine-tRNA-protein transferase domain-containing protein n=1 Tax=Rozella allomycis (strain CSF55) TaxID=988480 RepID=A0A075APU5_ROZAC|nr:Arginine-tRNA-protein transferase domain-containing protein [Rozella allomycis CSF55]RKP19497.1 hypothetical protein ROZALSC1DRAFT_28909 [Rozella allomycis CSF55]|eukprot:EPZ32236.1 Arginine-tRNA-protein transferase domain-containing protein [Rozella allomycis CSF55]